MSEGLLRIALAAVAAAATLALATAGAGAQAGGGCPGTDSDGPCVMLIQVDGLEATDVTPEKTPFLWAFSHPSAAGTPGVTAGRNAWIWQASRAAMSAGLGANTASMLTGGYAEQTGISGDDFFLVPSEGEEVGGRLPTFNPKNSERHRLETDPSEIADDVPLGEDSVGSGVNTIFRLNEEAGNKSAAYIGDPDLAGFAGMHPEEIEGEDRDDNTDTTWTPRARTQEHRGDDLGGNPAFCDVPRNPNPTPTGSPPIVDTDPEAQSLRSCAAKDEVTLNAANDGLTSDDGQEANLAWIELAELGHIKRMDPSNQDLDAAVRELDAQLGLFLHRYANSNNTAVQEKWADTIVFVTGSGGYEDTPLANRVPNPNDPEQDLAHFVANFDGPNNFALAHTGTVGTVYSTPDGLASGETAENPSAAHVKRVQDLKHAIEGQVEDACGTDCIAEVLYMRPNLAPPGEEDQVVERKHPSWHLDHTYFDINRDTFEEARVRSGSGGDLLVVTEPGWALGKAVPADDELLAEAPDSPISNPYPASTGGPRNRSMAAIVNGPACTGEKCVFNLAAEDNRGAATGGRYPVATTSEGPADAPQCNGTAPIAHPESQSTPLEEGVVAANADPSDDANATGHECQAEIVDVGPTIAAVLGLQVPFQQIGGRLLHEAINGLPEITERPAQEPPAAFLVAGPIVAAEGEAYPASFDGLAIFGFIAQPDRPEAPTFECQLASGEIAHTDLPEGGWFACGDPPEARPDLCKQPSLDDNQEPIIGPDGEVVVEPLPCHSLAITEPLAPGRYTFSVQARIKSGGLGPSKESTATFDVIPPPTVQVAPPPYDCPRVICLTNPKPKAYVSDDKGRPAPRVKKGKLLDNVTFKAGFGERLTAVDLTFYRADRKGKGKGQKRGKGKKKLTAIADFEPFVLKLKQDAIAKLGFEVPPAYEPTHLGVDLQVLKKRKLTRKRRKACKTGDNPLCAYKAVRRCRTAESRFCHADVYRIKYAGMLHEKAKGKCKGGKRHKPKPCKGKGDKLARLDVPMLRDAIRFG